MNVEEQIACIRRGESECHEKINEYADTMERLLAVYEAGLPVADFLRGDDGVTDVEVTEKFVDAIAAVKTTEQNDG